MPPEAGKRRRFFRTEANPRSVRSVNMNNSNLLLYFPKLQFLCMFHATIKYQDIWELLHFSSLNLSEKVWVTSFSVRIGLNALKSHIKENHVQNWQKIAMGHNKAWEEELLNKTKRLINAHKRNLTIKWGYDSFHIIIRFRPWNLIRRFLNQNLKVNCDKPHAFFHQLGNILLFYFLPKRKLSNEREVKRKK